MAAAGDATADAEEGVSQLRGAANWIFGVVAIFAIALAIGWALRHV